MSHVIFILSSLKYSHD